MGMVLCLHKLSREPYLNENSYTVFTLKNKHVAVQQFNVIVAIPIKESTQKSTLTK